MSAKATVCPNKIETYFSNFPKIQYRASMNLGFLNWYSWKDAYLVEENNNLGIVYSKGAFENVTKINSANGMIWVKCG